MAPGSMAAMDALHLLIDYIRPRLGGRPLLLGLAGAQGSGKSTLAAELAAQLTASGLPTRALSLDDGYLTAARRRALAARVHPLLATRGPPGSHDLPLLHQVLDRFRAGQPLQLPRFDKLADDRLAPQHWPATPPLACLILEGWCVGARPQPAAALATPVNALEAWQDADARWRTHINQALAGAYQQ
ncbi:kinase, partial [Sandarakinorhabdus rubra]|uniref:kinase n=1 Tax=Sandarakinorhabdus rubra TaxID=2672568 RepID=UPI0013DAE065